MPRKHSADLKHAVGAVAAFAQLIKANERSGAAKGRIVAAVLNRLGDEEHGNVGPEVLAFVAAFNAVVNRGFRLVRNEAVPVPIETPAVNQVLEGLDEEWFKTLAMGFGHSGVLADA